MLYEIPLTTDPNQEFKCLIPFGDENKCFIFNLTYNTIAKYWILKITDDSTGKVLLNSVPILTGENMLEQYEHLNIGCAIVINSAGANTTTEDPDDTNLGTDFLLIWGDETE